MKAKIKATGEIVDVENFGMNGDYTNYVSADGGVHHSMLNYYTDFEEIKEIDWEERRYEIVKSVIPSFIIANTRMDDAIELSIEVADRLIAELKRG